MGNAQKALVMAAGIFLAIALITIAVVMFISAQDATKTAQGNFSNIQTELAQTSFTVYDDTVVSGSQVVNALRKFQGTQEFGIEVFTGKDTSGQWYIHQLVTNGGSGAADYGTVADDGEGTLSDAQDEASDDYINPSGKFQASLVYDNSNVVRGIIFRQQAIPTTPTTP